MHKHLFRKNVSVCTCAINPTGSVNLFRLKFLQMLLVPNGPMKRNIFICYFYSRSYLESPSIIWLQNGRNTKLSAQMGVLSAQMGVLLRQVLLYRFGKKFLNIENKV